MRDAAIGQRRGRGGAPGKSDHSRNEAAAFALLRAGPDQPNLLGGRVSGSGTAADAKHAGTGLPQLFSASGKKLTPRFFGGNFQIADDFVAADSGGYQFKRRGATRSNEHKYPTQT